MQRYFVSNQQMTENQVIILGEDATHIKKVMRMQTGHTIVCINQNQRAVLCVLDSIDNTGVRATVVEELTEKTELPIAVTIAQGLPKSDKLEWIVQKGTELGATGFLPFSASRSVVKWDQKKSEKKRERLEKIAKEAAEQSYRLNIPQIHDSANEKAVIDLIAHHTASIVLAEEQAKNGETSQFSKVLSSLTEGDSLLVIVGPEGGLSESEVDHFQEAGAIPCGLGPRILRTETASLATLAAISYQFELMR
ncbi:16S rRNA (uracil(1498)-N(3))-methyltransferase [Alkalicoccobacillus porphyridii]|uniref:Ribosomal RNA small subunit methyltransferase E n=1 Tax=Alkalicoccobacillus porphyridii TaxID=2597270 RepID=A0A553ZZ92_9BACI|nr:16S rRNA (uracil(1498)-N(3))-methyltransferase [Alkalicoccobacillus porphyridii]TSB46770.1 16S rRNA (uracil(1498)-N(3))-methyltransferase [Alkalicoccobacillus porphyridii]